MAERYGSTPTVTIDGTPLAEDVRPALVRTVIDTQLHLPDMFVLHFHDSDRNVVTRAHLQFGTRVQIKTTGTADGAEAVVVTGEVTAFEQQTDATGTWTIVRGYDPLHRLCRGRRTRTFSDMTDGDIVRQVVSAAGLEIGRVDDGGPTHEHLSQANLTDWEFLRTRAQETGHEVAMVSGKLEWRTPAESTSAPGAGSDPFDPPAPLQLMLGRDLLRFRPRVTAAEQVGEVQVRGWDPQQKQAIVGIAQAASASAHVAVGPAELAKTFDAAPFVVVDRPVSTQDEADNVAAAVAQQIGAAHAEAEATAYGDPRLVPGAAVSIGHVGWPHDGDYVLTSARHLYDENGYQTDFTISGAQERSLLGLASIGATKGTRAPVHGLVIGQVTDADDPEKQFRVRVSFPWLSDDYESWWCRVAQPGAGHNRGMVWLPEVGDEVLVGFAHGDTRVPFVVGSLYNGVDTPPLADQLVDGGSGEVNVRGLVSRTNHRLVLDDGSSSTKVLLATGDEKLTITLDASQTAITIDSSGRVTISGSQGVDITSDSDISLKATGSLKLNGSAGVSIDGGPQVSVSGGLIKLN